MIRPLHGTALLAAVLVLAGCAASTAPSSALDARRPALLWFFSDSATVSLPDTVRRWQPLPVTFKSYGGGSISQGETDVAVRGLVAVIRPYRYEASASVVGTDILLIFQHVATVQFTQLGQAQVRILGERRPGNEPFEIVRTVTVTP